MTLHVGHDALVEGYLLIRNVIPSDAVEAAQKCLKAYLRENDNSVNKSNGNNQSSCHY